MQTMVQEDKIEVELGSELFVLVLIPQLPAFGVNRPLDLELCGRSLEDWTDAAIKGLAYRKVVATPGNDIISIVRSYATHHKYTMVMYADTPLVSRVTIDNCLTYIKGFSHKAVRLPRGWIFETEYIKGGGTIETVDMPAEDKSDWTVVYNFERLAAAERLMRRRINSHHMMAGVQIVSPDTTFIDHGVTIERGVLILPNTVINGKSYIGKGSKIGPFTNLRAGSRIGQNCRIGNFVEVKNSTIGDNTKVSHMTYVGDAVIGKNCNIGAGVVFCNFDGKTKHETKIGDNVFVGSNVNLVAPLKIDSNAFIAAGSTITQNVQSGDLAIARARQENRPKDAKVASVITPVKHEEPVKQEQKIIAPVEPIRIEPVTEIEPEPEEIDESAPETVFSKEIKRARAPKPKFEQIVMAEPESESEPVEEVAEVISEPEAVKAAPQEIIEDEPEKELEQVTEVTQPEIIAEPEPEEVIEDDPVEDEVEDEDDNVYNDEIEEEYKISDKVYDWDRDDNEPLYQGRD